MTDEEKSAVTWWEKLSDEELKAIILQEYRRHLAHVEELKALGFKWGVDQ